MEEEIYFDDFELILQEQVNRFKMVPEKKVWHGIYNDLHPGRRWPSVMVSLVLISSIVFIGNINRQVDKKSAHIHLQTPGIHDGKDFSKPGTINGNNKLSVKPVYQKNDKQNGVAQSNSGEAITLFNKKREISSSIDLSVLHQKASKINTTNSENTFALNQTTHSPIETSLESNPRNKKENNSVYDDAIIENSMSDNKLDIISNRPGISLSAKDLEISLSENLYEKLFRPETELIKTNTHIEELITSVGNDKNNVKNNSDNNKKAVLAITKKRNEKIKWVYYAGPFVSTVAFSGRPLKESPNLNLSVSPLPQVIQKDIRVIRNPALGFEAGLQMNYSFATKFHFTAGAHLTRSGYNIISNLVHPTLATLTLRNTSTGDNYSRNFVTHYGDGTGKSTVMLHNYSYQASIPMGVQYALWGNDNLQVNLAANFEPSLVFKADAYLLSGDGKNYVNVPDLMRKWNFSSNFGPFVSFSSNKFRWNIGPTVRYQWLSTYQKSYTVKEHLIDYGIRLGISK